MKRIILTLMLALSLLTLCACGKTKTVHCDKCGVEITLSQDSNIEENWIVFCKDCEEPVVSPG